MASAPGISFMRGMFSMQLTFLGTGTSVGIPVIGCDCAVCHSTDPHDKRLRSSVYIVPHSCT